MQKISSDQDMNSMMLANIQRLATRDNNDNSNSSQSPCTTSTTRNSDATLDTSEIDTYKLYSFNDERLLHRRADGQSSPQQQQQQQQPGQQRPESSHGAHVRRIESSIEAIIMLDKCRNELRDRKSTLGRECPHHPAVAETYTKMGLLHQHMLQEPGKALRYHEQALELLRKCRDEAASSDAKSRAVVEDDNHGDEHSEIGQNLHQRDQQDRLELVQRCTSDIATTLVDIGHIQRSLGQNIDALMSYQEAVGTFAMVGASEHHPARNAALAGISLMNCD